MLLSDLLRGQWGFEGFVVTDFTGISEMIEHGVGDLQTVSALALNAGVDMDMVSEGFVGTLMKSIKEGKVRMGTLNYHLIQNSSFSKNGLYVCRLEPIGPAVNGYAQSDVTVIGFIADTDVDVP